jgi:hypothetical protein
MRVPALALRVLMGVCEGVRPPEMSPADERRRRQASSEDHR